MKEKVKMQTVLDLNPLFPTAHPVRPLNEEISTLLVSVKVGHVRPQPKCLLPYGKLVYPLGREDVLGFVAPKGLV